VERCKNFHCYHDLCSSSCSYASSNSFLSEGSELLLEDGNEEGVELSGTGSGDLGEEGLCRCVVGDRSLSSSSSLWSDNSLSEDVSSLLSWSRSSMASCFQGWESLLCPGFIFFYQLPILLPLSIGQSHILNSFNVMQRLPLLAK